MIIKLGKPNKPYLTLPSCLTRPHQYKCLIPSVLPGTALDFGFVGRSTWRNLYQTESFLRIRTFPDIVDKRYHYKRKL